MQCCRYLKDFAEPFLECHISIIADSIVVILNNSRDDIGRASMETDGRLQIRDRRMDCFECGLKTWGLTLCSGLGEWR